MKVYTWEEDFMSNQILREIKLFGIESHWNENHEIGGIFIPELFTSYREASEWLLALGFVPLTRFWDKTELYFILETVEGHEEAVIHEMEVWK